MKALIILTVCAVTVFAGLGDDLWREANKRRPVGIDVFAAPIYGGRIIGGKEVSIEQYPFILSLRRGIHWCGASAISNIWVVSAAHCTENTNPGGYTLLGASSNRSSDEIIFPVASITNHGRYDNITLDFDVSVIKIKGTFEGTIITPVPFVFTKKYIEEGTFATVAGWGMTSPGGSLADNLMAVNVPIVSQKNCRQQWGESRITENMVCAGEPGRDSCNADSGGPLIVNGQLLGVVSWGDRQCGGSFAGVYADLRSPSVREFIENATARDA
ncbi:trypsin 3A1-like [Toxorhynchites rutilus septentrionalis]|uniref:trypsin 3A1-like n=1 Tax=Toxorhynchites rutilus septentrionalis TaxID=329112 RepID=UPI0024787AA5|nr:trypsin 3A1-like [Toxorhynchites rutilus septentrionalis]